MLIAPSLAASLLASAFSGAASASTTVPPMTITVSASSSISASVLRYMLAETDKVWRAAGLSFVWRHELDAADAAVVPAHGREDAPRPPSALRVVIRSGQAADAARRESNTMALGWIEFDDDEPVPEIYVSYDNATAYMRNAREVVGQVDRMPVMEREILLARAMGRALAHELGHYLLASKLHTPRGLMRASHTATEFFGYERSAFLVDAVQRLAIVERLQQDARVAMHDPR